MSSFKLIAITPLVGCHQKLSKKLTPGKIYQFYKDYDFTLIAEKTKLKTAKRQSVEPVPSIYKLNNNIAVNISAIVGKNGEGKSTIFELFYRAIYLMAKTGNFYDQKLLTDILDDLNSKILHARRYLATVLANYPNSAPDNFDHTKTAEPYALHEVPNEAILSEIVSKYKFHLDYSKLNGLQDFTLRVATLLNQRIIELEKEHDLEKEKDDLLNNHFNLSIVFSKDEVLYEMHCLNGEISYYIFGDSGEKKPFDSKPFSLEDFFYSISLNYSHHGLNSRSIGQWIIKLFHKNDGYRTPLVLNPMRDYGNYDINHEIRLSNERLMSTLAYDLLHKKKEKLLGKYDISNFIFTLKWTANEQLDDNNPIRKSAMKIVSEVYGIDPEKSDLPYAKAAVNYLTNKIPKIVDNYSFFVGSARPSPESVEDFLRNDTTHVSKKIRQVVNYLMLDKDKIKGKLKTLLEKQEVELNLDTALFLDFVNLFSEQKIDQMNPEELIDYALPGFFNIDFQFQKDLGENKSQLIKISEMSSGEQQSIFNNNTILYHLYNLQSVHPKTKPLSKDKRIKRPAYKHINLILDEMEMYYHPEMQRHFVAELMKTFAKLGKNSGITGINVSILTHSPFVLSDIPVNNILRLSSNEHQTLSQKQTFAANIHDLLRREFLLEKGFLGEFAREKIDLVIESLQFYKNIGKKKLSKSILEKYLNNNECKQIISMIGEPVLYRSLMEFYHDVYPKDQNFISEQIAFLQNLATNTATGEL